MRLAQFCELQSLSAKVLYFLLPLLTAKVAKENCGSFRYLLRTKGTKENKKVGNLRLRIFCGSAEGRPPQPQKMKYKDELEEKEF